MQCGAIRLGSVVSTRVRTPTSPSGNGFSELWGPVHFGVQLGRPCQIICGWLRNSMFAPGVNGALVYASKGHESTVANGHPVWCLESRISHPLRTYGISLS